jgi:hypothetical protein
MAMIALGRASEVNASARRPQGGFTNLASSLHKVIEIGIQYDGQ